METFATSLLTLNFQQSPMQYCSESSDIAGASSILNTPSFLLAA
jgi:hypothetical protein